MAAWGLWRMDLDTIKAWMSEPSALWAGGLLLLAAIALIPLLRGRRKRAVPARLSDPVPASEPAPPSPAIPAAMQPPPRATAPEKTMTKASDLFIACLEQALGRVADKRLLPMQPGDVDITYADITKAQQLFAEANDALSVLPYDTQPLSAFAHYVIARSF